MLLALCPGEWRGRITKKKNILGMERSKRNTEKVRKPKQDHRLFQFFSKGWFSLAHKHNISITSENTCDISESISRNIRRTNPLICLMLFSLAHKHKHKHKRKYKHKHKRKHKHS